MKTIISALVVLVLYTQSAQAAWPNWGEGYAAVGDWAISESVDEMTGDRSSWLESRLLLGTDGAYMVIGCYPDGTLSIYVQLASLPTVSNDTPYAEYNVSTQRIRYDDELTTVDMQQFTLAKEMHFRTVDVVKDKLLETDKVTLEIPQSGRGKVIYKFKTSGLREAMAATNVCK